MRLQRNNLYLIVFSLLLLLLLAGLKTYFSKVSFIGDFNISLNTQIDYSKKIEFFAITPTGKQQQFYKKNDGLYNLSGYYNAIYISIDTNIISKANKKDSIVVDVNDKKLVFLFKVIFNKWEGSLSGNKRSYALPATTQTNISILSKLNAVLFFTDFAPIPLVIYTILCLFVLIALLLYFKFRSNFLIKLHHITRRTFIVFSVLLTALYFFAFLKISSFSNTVPLSGDSWEYQVMAVNFAKGYGVQRLSMLENLETYKFSPNDIDAESQYNLKIFPYYVVDTYRTPGYSVFLGLIYKVAGINPFAVKVLQLFLLCLVAAFLPLLLLKIWQWKGFLSGLAGGFVFILSYYQTAGDIMTEVLLIFFVFLIVWTVVSYSKKPSYFLSISIGIIMGISLLVKGMLIFVPILFFGTLIYYYLKSSDRFFKKNVLIIFLFFIMTMLPWALYASYMNKFLLIEPISKEQIITATTSVDRIFENTLINSDNIVEITDSISNIYYRNNYWEAKRYYFVKDFIKKRPDLIRKTSEQTITFIKKEMNQFYRGHLKYYSIPFFNKKYLYINLEGLTLLSIQPKTLLLESNNEHCTDGGWHQGKKYADFYYNTDNNKSLSILRVIKFYYKNPKMIYKIFPAKLHTGFKSFIFWQLLISLIIISFIKSLIANKYRKRWSILIILIFVPALLYLFQVYNFLLSLSILAAFLIMLFMYFHNKNPYPFTVPRIFNIFLLNLLIITIVFYGLNRFTFITEILVIPTTLLYLAYMLSDALGDGNNI